MYTVLALYCANQSHIARHASRKGNDPVVVSLFKVGAFAKRSFYVNYT